MLQQIMCEDYSLTKMNENWINPVGIKMYCDLVRLLYVACCLIFFLFRFSFVFSFFRPFNPLSFSFSRTPLSAEVLLRTFVCRFYAHRAARKWASSAIQTILKVGKRDAKYQWAFMIQFPIGLAIGIHKVLRRILEHG